MTTSVWRWRGMWANWVPVRACCTCGWNGPARGEDWDEARKDAKKHRIMSHGERRV
jgi:hypothetical protein